MKTRKIVKEKVSLLKEQRNKVKTQKIYGIWCDLNQLMELKIFPTKHGAGVKVWSVSDLSLIRRISLMCGLDNFPKRKIWKGFDIITHLERKNSTSLVNGIVEMPNSKRRNFVDIKFTNQNIAHLEFFYESLYQLETVRNYCGSLQLKRAPSESNARNPKKAQTKKAA